MTFIIIYIITSIIIILALITILHMYKTSYILKYRYRDKYSEFSNNAVEINAFLISSLLYEYERRKDFDYTKLINNNSPDKNYEINLIKAYSFSNGYYQGFKKCCDILEINISDI